MNKNYDEFTKMKPKEMSKAISDMTYSYINPETNLPTTVPSTHYEKILNTFREEVIAEETKRLFLNTIVTQLKAIRDEEPRLFQQAQLCLDMNINPKDLRQDELISLMMTSDYIDELKDKNKKNFHIIDKNIVDTFNSYKEDRELHSQFYEKTDEPKEDKKTFKYKDYER